MSVAHRELISPFQGLGKYSNERGKIGLSIQQFRILFNLYYLTRDCAWELLKNS